MFISLCISVVLIKLQFDIDQKRLNDYTCIILQVWLTPPLPGCWPIRGLPGGGQIDPPIFLVQFVL